MFLQQCYLGKESLFPLRITRSYESKLQNFPRLMQEMYRYTQVQYQCTQGIIKFKCINGHDAETTSLVVEKTNVLHSAWCTEQET